DPALDKGRAEDARRERSRDFGAERERIATAEITVSDVTAEIVAEIVLEVDLVEEPGLDVVGVDKRICGGEHRPRRERGEAVRSGIAELDAGDALQGKATPVIFGFAGDMSDAHAAEAVPIGFADIDAEEGARGIAPEQVRGGGGEGVAVEAAHAAVELCAVLRAYRHGVDAIDPD